LPVDGVVEAATATGDWLLPAPTLRTTVADAVAPASSVTVRRAMNAPPVA
jgi:hypothetical protein